MEDIFEWSNHRILFKTSKRYNYLNDSGGDRDKTFVQTRKEKWKN